MNVKKLELINRTNQYINELKSHSPQIETLEWYLINNLEEYLNSIKKANSGIEIEKASKILDRFCLESMDWDTTIFKKCSELTKFGLKLSKV
ncbi:MAG: hypothetical protein H0U71_09025 [Gammaproteobacteria bacterium]|nr:hypothetical protein [Gammaproteobacteria bacterium]